MATYFHAPRREYRKPGGLPVVLPPRDLDDPEFWIVYRSNEDGVNEWIADFAEEADAAAFCSLKNLTED